MTEKKRVIRRPARPASERKISMNCFAAVPRGAEEIAAAELQALDIQGARAGRGGVSFATDHAGLYRANLWLRTASRILVTMTTFPCASPEDLYAGVHSIVWHDLIRPSMTLAVDCTLRDSAITHSGFVALKTKDAIVDRIRTHCGTRPSVNTSSPDVRINIHLARNVCTVSLDSSGDALDRRGYRLERTEAPLRETLASAVIALTGWDGAMPLTDPMCGSGTIPRDGWLLGVTGHLVSSAGWISTPDYGIGFWLMLKMVFRSYLSGSLRDMTGIIVRLHWRVATLLQQVLKGRYTSFIRPWMSLSRKVIKEW